MNEEDTGHCVRDFSWALHRLKEGKRLIRSVWSNAEMWIELRQPADHSKMDNPHIHIMQRVKTNDPDDPSRMTQWIETHTDMLAEDWEVVA